VSNARRQIAARRSPGLACIFVLGVALASIFLAAPAVGLAAQKPDSGGSQRSARVSAAVGKVMHRYLIPGAIVGIWRKGQAPYVRGFGVRQIKTFGADGVAIGKPMTPNLLMRIGSETKTFTGTAVLQLVDEGKVKLDDPIGKYVKGVPNGDAITVRELGEMRSGLQSYTANEAWDKQFLTDPHQVWSPQELLSDSFSQPPLFAPDAGFNYSNTNFILLGLLVEAVSGQKLGNYIARHVLAPAHLDHTVFPTTTAFPKPHAQGYTGQTLSGKLANATTWNPSWAWAAGAMISNLQDLRTWARTVATGALLAPATQRQRERFIPVPGLAPARYGFALFDVNGWIGHNGETPGYESLTVYLPSKAATMVILLNADVVLNTGVKAPETELTTLVGKAITKVITPSHIFDFGTLGE
jgi:D-alanyl-D-alanine carboxypeptidase